MEKHYTGSNELNAINSLTNSEDVNVASVPVKNDEDDIYKNVDDASEHKHAASQLSSLTPGDDNIYVAELAGDGGLQDSNTKSFGDSDAEALHTNQDKV